MSKMIESEKFAVRKYQKDLERWLPMTQSFLRHFVDKNILRLDQRQQILKLPKTQEQVRMFIQTIMTVPGAFRVLVDILKKDRNSRYISFSLEDCKKHREKQLSEARKKRMERQMQKAQDDLMHQIGDRLAPLAIGKPLRSLEIHTFEHHVTEASRLITILEQHKVEIEMQEGIREMSLPKLAEYRQMKQNKRFDDIRKKNHDLLRENADLKEKAGELMRENERIHKNMESDKENMRRWQESRFELSKNDCEARIRSAKEKMKEKNEMDKQLMQELFESEKKKLELELTEINRKYDKLIGRCRCNHAKADTGVQVEERDLLVLCEEREMNNTSAPPCLDRDLTHRSEISNILAANYTGQMSVESVPEVVGATGISQDHIFNGKTIINNYIIDKVNSMQIQSRLDFLDSLTGKGTEEFDSKEAKEE